MAFDTTNTIRLNMAEQKHEKSPKLLARININGVEYKASIWERKPGADGKRWWSGPVEPFEPHAAKSEPAPDNWSDEIPF